MNGGQFSLLFATGALSALAFVLMPNSPSRADFQSGREAYISGDYVKAFEEFLPSAMQGNVRSRIGLGLLLARGQGMKPDFVGSYAWFDMASVEGNGEHVVVRILARTNRDFLRKHMTDEQVARAKLRSTMILATPETLKIPVPLRSNSVSHTRKNTAHAVRGRKPGKQWDECRSRQCDALSNSAGGPSQRISEGAPDDMVAAYASARFPKPAASCSRPHRSWRFRSIRGVAGGINSTAHAVRMSPATS